MRETKDYTGEERKLEVECQPFNTSVCTRYAESNGTTGTFLPPIKMTSSPPPSHTDVSIQILKCNQTRGYTIWGVKCEDVGGLPKWGVGGCARKKFRSQVKGQRSGSKSEGLTLQQVLWDTRQGGLLLWPESSCNEMDLRGTLRQSALNVAESRERWSLNALTERLVEFCNLENWICHQPCIVNVV